MAGNPKESSWYSTPAEKRVRKPLTVTVEDSTRELVEQAAKKQGVSMSTVVEECILAHLSAKKTKKRSP